MEGTDAMTVKQDHVLEWLFSGLRWIFLVAGVVIYGIYEYESPGQSLGFGILVLSGASYMTLASIALHRSSPESRSYILLTRGGVIFDCGALLCLLALTGGTGSPLLPIAYLVILHGAVYWRLAGGLWLAVLLQTGYLALHLWVDPGTGAASASMAFHVMNLIFLLMVGLLGGLIVARERKHLNEKCFYEGMANQDYLTGLRNHRSFQDSLRWLVQEGNPLILVMADIDYFKQVNDRHGHVIGDKVLQEIGAMLERGIPRARGTAFRYGGEEFALLLQVDQIQEADGIVQAFRRDLAKLMIPAGTGSVTVTMSFGAVKRSGENPTELVQLADGCLYEAKRQGRNRVIWYSDDLTAGVHVEEDRVS